MSPPDPPCCVPFSRKSAHVQGSSMLGIVLLFEYLLTARVGIAFSACLLHGARPLATRSNARPACRRPSDCRCCHSFPINRVTLSVPWGRHSSCQAPVDACTPVTSCRHCFTPPMREKECVGERQGRRHWAASSNFDAVDRHVIFHPSLCGSRARPPGQAIPNYWGFPRLGTRCKI